MTNQELIAQFLQSHRPTRVPVGRRTYSRRAISALAEGPDFKLDVLRSDQAAGLIDSHGRKTEAERAKARLRRRRARLSD